MSGVVRTVLGDRPADDLGTTLGHEHLIARPPALVTDPDLRLDRLEPALEELAIFKQAGGSAVVEMTTVDYGRDAEALRKLSRESDISVVAATGFNKGKFADHIVSRYEPDAIARWMIGELSKGMLPYGSPESFELVADRRTAACAGLIKASSSEGGPGEHERTVFEAAVTAHHETGAPLSTHTEKGDWALEQAELLTGSGVSADKVLIGHLDFRTELEYLLDVAATGVNLGFDQFSKEKYLPDAERVRMICQLSERGHGRQLIIGGDLARRSYWPAYDGTGAGLAHIPMTVVPMLRDNGFSDGDIEQLLVENPLRWLAFEPRSGAAAFQQDQLPGRQA